MAQWSLGWTTNGTGDGASGGYTQAEFTEWIEALTTQNNVNNGVLKNYGSALAVSASGGSASPVTIENGAALVKGFFYRNDAAGTLAIPTPAAATRIDRIVLQADWAAQTVRAARVAGDEGGGTPALTQTDETTWEIPLATVSTTTGGVATVTDGRVWIRYNTNVVANMLETDAVTTTKVIADAITSAKIADDAVGSAHIAADSILTANIVDGQVTAVKIANRTRTFFVQAMYGDDAGNVEVPESYYGRSMKNDAGTGGDVVVSSLSSVPQDYASGFKVAPRFTAPGSPSGNAYLSTTVWYGDLSVGSSDTRAIAVTSAPFSGTAVHLLGVSAANSLLFYARRQSANGADTSSDTIRCAGFQVTYTADS